MPTPSAHLRKPAISSIQRWPSACTTISIHLAARVNPKTPILRSEAGSRSPMRYCAGGDCWKHPRPPEVKNVLRQVFRLLLMAVVFALAAGSAQAHRHVWITASSELIYAPDGSITGVRHAWAFDDMFSTYALQGIETKTKGVYSREELGPLAQTNVESLKEFGFFTFARRTAKRRNSSSRSITFLITRTPC